MLGYVVRKALLAIPLVLGVITILFVLLELAPGTPADQYVGRGIAPETRELLIARWGLDQPMWWRYLVMLRNLCVLDFGTSLTTQRPVLDMVLEAVPNTLLLGATTLAVLFPAGVLVGVIQALRPRGAVDTGASLTGLFLYSMPTFWLAMLLQATLGYQLGWFPIDGRTSVLYRFWSVPWQALDVGWHLILPGVAIGLAQSAGAARYMRAALLDVIGADYVRTARAKGVPERRVIAHHAVRNALLPMITLFGLSVPALFTGSVLVETVFAWPGMGLLIVDAIWDQDTPVIVGTFFVITLAVVAGNLFADVATAWADPRIRFQ